MHGSAAQCVKVGSAGEAGGTCVASRGQTLGRSQADNRAQSGKRPQRRPHHDVELAEEGELHQRAHHLAVSLCGAGRRAGGQGRGQPGQGSRSRGNSEPPRKTKVCIACDIAQFGPFCCRSAASTSAAAERRMVCSQTKHPVPSCSPLASRSCLIDQTMGKSTRQQQMMSTRCRMSRHLQAVTCAICKFRRRHHVQLCRVREEIHPPTPAHSCGRRWCTACQSAVEESAKETTAPQEPTGAQQQHAGQPLT